MTSEDSEGKVNWDHFNKTVISARHQGNYLKRKGSKEKIFIMFQKQKECALQTIAF